MGANGRFQLAVPIPNAPALSGLAVVLQAVVGPSSAAAGVDFTNAVRWTLGQ